MIDDLPSDLVQRCARAAHGIISWSTVKKTSAVLREAGVAEMAAALEAMLQAVCGETGFANAVRVVSGTAYPWPALDIAEAEARAALSRYQNKTCG